MFYCDLLYFPYIHLCYKEMNNVVFLDMIDVLFIKMRVGFCFCFFNYLLSAPEEGPEKNTRPESTGLCQNKEIK